MSSSDAVIRANNLSKCYQIYDAPRDRLKQFIAPRLQRMVGVRPKQYYREFWALKDVSFEIQKGETVGVIGKNGCGKSTLLQILCGTLTPTTGCVEVQGRIAALLELGSGFNPEFTGRDNVYLNGAILGLSREDIDTRIDDILAFADIGDFIDQPVKTYSSGMFVRLAFATQAYVDPDILIVDEALAVGDSYFVHKCMQRFHYMQKRGTTILLVSHDATAIKTLCKRAIWLDHGEISGVGSAGVVVDQYLSAARKQPVYVDFGLSTSSVGDGVSGSESQVGSLQFGEAGIPHIDRRMGDQSCSFVGVGLYDKHMCRSTIIANNSTVVLRVTFMNNSLQEGDLLIVGYSLRNNRGIDIASNNSEIEKVFVRSPEPGGFRTVRMCIAIPELHPGSYSFSISLGRRDEDGRMCSLDGITNAVVFDVVSERPVHVLMSLKTEFEVE